MAAEAGTQNGMLVGPLPPKSGGNGSTPRRLPGGERVEEHDRGEPVMQRRRHLLAAAAVAGACAMPDAPAAQGSTQAALEAFAATLTAHDIAAFGDLLADYYINHQISAAVASPPDLTAKQATTALFAARLRGLPDLSVSIEASVAAGDTGAASFVYVGTHTAPYLGVAPTGRRLRFTSCDIFRVRDGRIVEHWGMGDVAGILAQLRS